MHGRPRLTYEERKARREERRAKQRAANVGRAAKTHAARVAAEGESLFAAEKDESLPAVNVGCSGWF